MYVAHLVLFVWGICLSDLPSAKANKIWKRSQATTNGATKTNNSEWVPIDISLSGVRADPTTVSSPPSNTSSTMEHELERKLLPSSNATQKFIFASGTTSTTKSAKTVKGKEAEQKSTKKETNIGPSTPLSVQHGKLQLKQHLDEIGSDGLILGNPKLKKKKGRRQMMTFIEDAASILLYYPSLRLVEFVQAMTAEIKNYYYYNCTFATVFDGADEHRVHFNRMFDYLGTEVAVINQTISNYTSLHVCSKTNALGRFAKILDESYQHSLPAFATMTNYLDAYADPSRGNFQTLVLQVRKFLRNTIFDHISHLDPMSKAKFANQLIEITVPPLSPFNGPEWTWPMP